MGQLVLATAGSLIGGAIGGPLGAKAGFAIGSLAGSAIFGGADGQHTEGPRLGDLSVTGSSYGSVIPILYGTVRVGGNVIWAEDIEEVKATSSSSAGGKGGAENTASTYTYFGSFAVSFGEGVAEDVTRIWADGKLIFDKTGAEDVVNLDPDDPSGFGALAERILARSITRKTGLNFRFYKGDEEQLPDSLIEADKGVGNVPAHRGTVYIVFDRLPLADFGNRIPIITAEIAMVSTPTYPSTQFSVINALIENGRNNVASYDYTRKKLYLGADEGGIVIRRFSAPLMQEEYSITAAEAWADFPDVDTTTSPAHGDPANDIIPLHADPNTGFLIGGARSTAIAQPVIKIDPNTLKVTHRFGVIIDVLNDTFNSTTLFTKTFAASIITINDRSFVCTSGYYGTLGILDLLDMTYIWGAGRLSKTTGSLTSIPNPRSGRNALSDPIPAKKHQSGQEVVWLSMEDLLTEFWVQKVIVSYNADYDTVAAQTVGLGAGLIDVGKITVADFITAGADADTVGEAGSGTSPSNAAPICTVYDPDTDSVLGVQALSTGSYAFSINPNDATLNWVTKINASKYNVGNGLDNSNAPVYDIEKTPHFIFGVWTLNSYYKLDKVTGELIDTYLMSAWGGDHNGFFAAYDADFHAVINQNDGSNEEVEEMEGIMYLDRGAGGSVPLTQVVADLSNRAGLEAADIDTTELVGDVVKGYAVSRVSTVRAASEPLATAYAFDAVESDGKLKFVKRGGASVATITQDDLGSKGGDNDYWVQTRTQEQELPMRLTVGYNDINRDYQEGAESVKRSSSPFPVMYSKNEETLSLPIVFNSTEARGIAESLLYRSWVERDNYETILPWKYLALDPADIITVNLDDGATYTARLGAINMGADLSLDISGVSEDIANYSSTLIGEDNFVDSTISGAVSATKLIAHNVPLLADTHDQARGSSVIYIQAAPYTAAGAWAGVTVYKSNNNIDWTVLTRVVNEASYGTTTSSLGTPADVFAIDTINTLDIIPVVGGNDLVSITTAQLLDGALNMVVVGDEVINFKNVTDNGDGSYTLDTFLRGRRGTDTVADSHSTGENYYLVSTDNTDGSIIPLSDIGNNRYFKAVGAGQTLEDVPLITVVPTGEDLKPYAPVNATRTADTPAAGDITVGWTRRTRISGGGVGTLPLNEDTESYEVDILDGTGGTVLRTLASTSESVEYDTADITADFGSVPTTLYVRIYQLSAQVGRGKSYEFALT